MKLKCYRCWKLVKIIVHKNGPHFQATCPICNRYIKFLNKKQRNFLLNEIIYNGKRLGPTRQNI